MTNEEAANKLGMSKQSLRLWIISGKCPFGIATKKYTRWNYKIFTNRLEAFINADDMKKSATCSEGSALSD